MSNDDLRVVDSMSLLDCFGRKLTSVDYLTWEGSSEPNVCEGLPNAIPEIPIYVLGFDGSDTKLVLALSYKIIPVESEKLGLEQANAIAKMADPIADIEQLIRLHSAVSLRDFLAPVDSLLVDEELTVEKVSIVCKPSKEIMGIFLWFHFGTSIGFIVGPAGNPAVLFGDAIEEAYQNALLHQQSGSLGILEREFDASSDGCKLTLNDIDWFC